MQKRTKMKSKTPKREIDTEPSRGIIGLIRKDHNPLKYLIKALKDIESDIVKKKRKFRGTCAATT